MGELSGVSITFIMIEWVHRTTRGFSNGASLVDPRTGEIIRAEVSLGSLRDRQDYLIAESLLSPYKENGDVDLQIEKMVLGRMRQLAAHEVSHTLGLGHNHAASATGMGGSLTDYPFPLIKLNAKGKSICPKPITMVLASGIKLRLPTGIPNFQRARAKRISRPS